MQLHTAHMYLRDDTLEVGPVIGLLSVKLGIGTAFDKFSDKLKGYVKRETYNENYGMCVVTDMDNPMKFPEKANIPKYLDKEVRVSTYKIHG